MMHPTAEDKVTIAVICYDLGEFARWHPRGKKYVNRYADFISYTEITALVWRERLHALYLAFKTCLVRAGSLMKMRLCTTMA